MLKVGVIGTGFATRQYHLPAWSQIAGCEVTAICDINRERLAEASSTFSVAKTYLDHREMLDDGHIDIVTIATPACCHHEQMIAALDHGAHVVVEKPMAVTFDQCASAIDKASVCGKKLMCLHQNRFKPATIHLRKLIDAGELGQVYYARLSGVRSRGVPTPEHFRLDPKLGGGPVFDLGSHLIDVAWFLLGKPEFESVTAHCWNVLARALSKSPTGASDFNVADYRCEDLAVAQIRFTNGSVVNLEIGYLANLPFSTRIECTLWGTKAGASWPQADVFSPEAGELRTVTADLASTPPLGVTMFESFVRSVRSGQPVAIDPRESAKVIKIIEEIHRSCRDNTQPISD